MNIQKFKAWDPSENKFLHADEFELYYEEDNGLNSGIFEDDGDYVGFDVLQSTILRDSSGIEAWEGDIRLYKSKKYVLVNEGWRWKLDRSKIWAGDNENHVVNEDVIFERELLGNIYENHELLK